MFQSGYEVTELREEDIIEAVPGTTVVMTSAGAVVTTSGSTTTSNVHDAVAAAVNEAIKVGFFYFARQSAVCLPKNCLQLQDIEYTSDAAEVAAAEVAAAVENNVRVEAQPVATHANMSPETLTAISGGSSPQPQQGTQSESSSTMQELFTGTNSKHN